jgi:hypothetical protein
LDPDLALVVGIVIGVLAIPSLVSALSERRAPRVPAVALLLSGVLLVYAFRNTGVPYTVDSLPNVVMKVIGDFL